MAYLVVRGNHVQGMGESKRCVGRSLAEGVAVGDMDSTLDGVPKCPATETSPRLRKGGQAFPRPDEISVLELGTPALFTDVSPQLTTSKPLLRSMNLFDAFLLAVFWGGRGSLLHKW